MSVENKTKKAAQLYHAIYPRSNFYMKSVIIQEQFIKIAEELYK